MIQHNTLIRSLLLLSFLSVAIAGPLITGQRSSKITKTNTQNSQVISKTYRYKASSKPSIIYDVSKLGKASWYGNPFHGRLTANGEIYDMNKLTAAHKSLPFDTIVKVTNLINSESVMVRINDRGPYIHGRDIDLSLIAAKHLNMVGTGVAPVKLEIMVATNKFIYRGHKISRR